MAKTKKDKTPHYEMLYIVSNKFTEEEVTPIVEKVNKMITKNGGTITYEEKWGKKKLAYPINHFNHGYYQLVEFDGKGENMAQIDREMRMSSEILRHQIVSAIARTAEEIKKEKEEKKRKVQKQKAQKEETEAVAEEKKERREKKEEKVEELKPAKEKADMLDLDEKLEKILETDDLL